MAHEGLEAVLGSFCSYFPELHASIIATTRQDCPVGAEGESPDQPGVSCKGQERFPIGYLPNTNLSVKAAHSQIHTIRTKCHGDNAFNGFPADTTQADWELELGVIIGRAARHVSRTEALSYVAGYTIVNDLTSRDKVYRADMKAIGTDWLLSKSSPSFLPMGPYLVPAAFVSDPQQLHLTLKLNGQVMQDEGTDDMIFGVARLIEYISQHVQLWPGDLICTGSPRGNGMHYNRFLRPGDVLEGTITRLGMQRNTCIAEGA